MTYRILSKAFLVSSILGASSLSVIAQGAAPSAIPATEAKPTVAPHDHKATAKNCPGCDVKKLKHDVAELARKLNELQAKEDQEVKALKEELAKNTAVDKKQLNTGNPNVQLTLSGWVNRAMGLYDTGHNKEIAHVDNNGQSTRTTLSGSSTLNDRYKAGFNLEFEYISANSKTTDIKTGYADMSFKKRIIEVFMKTWLGDVYMGHGPMTCNRAALSDLTGINAIFEGNAFSDIAGGMRFATGRGALTTTAGASDRTLQIQSVYNEILASKRYDRVSYITPKFAGFTLGLTHARRDRSDFTLRYSGELSGTKIVAALAWFHDAYPQTNTFESSTTTLGAANPSAADNKVRKLDQYGGSFAVLFPVGISFNLAYAEQHYKTVVGYSGRSKGKTWGGKLGYQHEFFSIGKTCLAVGYGESKSVMANAPYTNGTVDATSPTQRYAGDNSAKTKVYGFYLNQQVDKLGSEIYLAYQLHKLSIRNGVTVGATSGQISVNNATTATSTTDLPTKKISVIMLGMRLKF